MVEFTAEGMTAGLHLAFTHWTSIEGDELLGELLLQALRENAPEALVGAMSSSGKALLDGRFDMPAVARLFLSCAPQPTSPTPSHTP